MAPQRLRMRWKEKHAIVLECRRRNVTGGYRKILSVCEWAFQALELVKKPSYQTVLLIIRDGTRIEMKAKSTHLNMKSDLSVTCSRIENMLIEWVWKMSRNEIFLMDDVILEKAKRIQAACNRQPNLAQKTHLRFSNGWLHRFKKRNGFRGWNTH